MSAKQQPPSDIRPPCPRHEDWDRSSLIEGVRVAERNRAFFFSRKDLRRLAPYAQNIEKQTAQCEKEERLCRVDADLWCATGVLREGVRYIGELADRLRPSHLNYLSFEAALNAWGALMQLCLRHTFATTGAPGAYDTPLGWVCFDTVDRSFLDVFERTDFRPDYGARMAQPELAMEDTQSVRNMAYREIDSEGYKLAVAEVSHRTTDSYDEMVKMLSLESLEAVLYP